VLQLQVEYYLTRPGTPGHPNAGRLDEISGAWINMSQAKQEALELIQRMPDTATTADILDELYFKEQVDRGLSDVVEGRTISHQELKERITQWRKSTGR
jgi:hypothetical protein